MPTTYAHDLFGKMVYQGLDKELQNVIIRHKTAYSIGLHGPDILFYVRPFQSNRINQLGHEIHRENASGFFLRGKKLYEETKNEELLVYLLGFACHFMLDSSCHPCVSRYMEKTGASHDEIETEFDRSLMEMTGRNPFRYHPASVIRIEKDCLETISSVFEGMTPKDIRRALLGMHFYTGITVCGSSFKRNWLLGAAKIFGIHSLVQGRVMKKNPVRRCEQSNGALLDLLKLAVPETVTVLEEFYRNRDETEEIACRFERNYN